MAPVGIFPVLACLEHWLPVPVTAPLQRGQRAIPEGHRESVYLPGVGHHLGEGNSFYRLAGSDFGSVAHLGFRDIVLPADLVEGDVGNPEVFGNPSYRTRPNKFIKPGTFNSLGHGLPQVWFSRYL